MNINEIFNTMMPHGTKEVVCYIVIILLIITIFVYNKGVLKTRDIIQSYIEEIKEKNRVIGSLKSVMHVHNIDFDEETGELINNG